MLPADPLFEALRSMYHDPVYEGNYGLRTLKRAGVSKEIDRILLSPDLTFLDASAPDIGPSDHYPVQMRLKRQRPGGKEAASPN